MFHNKHPGRDFMIGAMIGSTLGALTAMACNSKKGHKVQKELAHKYHEFEHLFKGYWKKGKAKVRSKAKKLARRAKKRRK